jgi:hypothetical protein
MGGVGDGKVMGVLGKNLKARGFFACGARLWVVCLRCWSLIALLSVWLGLALAVCLRRWPFLVLLSVY